jgi:hypothetical protein
MDLINQVKKMFPSSWAKDFQKPTVGISPPSRLPAATSRAIIHDTLFANMRGRELQPPIAFQASPSSAVPAETSRALVHEDLLTNIHPAELQELAALQVSASSIILAASSDATIRNNLMEDGETPKFQRPVAFASSQFHKLPVELLRQIRDHLMLHQLQCFQSVACRCTH